MSKKFMKKIVSFMLIMSMICGSSVLSFAQDTTKEIECIYSKDGKSVVQIKTQDNKEFYLATVETNPESEGSLKSLSDSENKGIKTNLIDVKDVEKKLISGEISDDESEYTYYNRIYFDFYDSKEEAIESVSSKRQKRDLSGFWHGSYVEDYNSWAGHGYRIYLSARDAGYITNLGWVAADTTAAGLATLAIISNGAAVVLGAIATVAVLTLYWKEQNDDGSLDVWSPDSMRPSSIKKITGYSLGTAKIGSSWYPLVTP